MAVDKKNDVVDPSTESINMYKHILCLPFINNNIALHLSEPFNVDVEYGRVSESTQDFELLDKNFSIIEKIKISNILNLDLNGGAFGNNLSSSGGSASGGTGNTPPSSPQSTPRKESSKANLLLGIDNDVATAVGIKSSKASMLLGLSGDESVTPQGTPKANSKASMLLGLEEQSPTSSAKKGGSTISSPKFGLLARSASNSKLTRDKEQSSLSIAVNSSPVGSAGSVSSSPSLASSTGMVGSPLSQSLGYASGSVLGSSPGSLNGGSPNSPSLPAISNLFPLHYSFIFTIQTKTVNYSFNARDKDESSQLVDALKLAATGKAYHPETQNTLDAITEAFDLANKCKSPPIPSLPLSPPPPPPHLLKSK